MNEHSKSKKYIFIGIGILIMAILVWRTCKPDIKKTVIEDTVENKNNLDSLPPYFTDGTKLIPQIGNFSCWAATLNMMQKVDSSLNGINTSPIRTDSLYSYLANYSNSNLGKMQDPDWNKIRLELYNHRPMAVYKYYNETFAHVFVVRGYHQTKKSKWLLVNDPWPVKKAKITAIDFRNFTRPFDGKNTYQNMNYHNNSSDKANKTESNFNIYSAQNLSSSNSEIYMPPIEKVAKVSQINNSRFKPLTDNLIKEFKSMDSEFFKAMNIIYNPKVEDLKADYGTLISINNFNNTASFMSYKLGNSMKPDYLFNASRQTYINFNNNKNKALICSTIEYEDKTNDNFLYVTRFEAYGRSIKADWDLILNDFKGAYKNPLIAKLFNSNTNKKSANFIKKETFEKLPEFEDISSLPVYGGPIYSFILPGFNEKIVADPYRQLKLKSGQKALFVGESGTPYYRLSAISLPNYGEIIRPISINEIPVEWKEKNQNTTTSSNTKPDTNILIDTKTDINTNENNSPIINIDTIKIPAPISGNLILNTPKTIDPRIILDKILKEKNSIFILDKKPIFDGRSIILEVDPDIRKRLSDEKIKKMLIESLGKMGRNILKDDYISFKEFKKYIAGLKYIILDTKKIDNPIESRPDLIEVKKPKSIKN